MKFILWAILICLLLVTYDLYAFQGKLIPIESSKEQVVQGDIFRAVMQVWPVKYSIEEKKLYSSLKGKFIFHDIYVLSVDKVEYSSINRDVILLELTLIARETINPEVKWKGLIGKKNIMFTMSGFSFEELKEIPEELILFDQEYSFSSYSKALIVISVFIFLMLSCLIYYIVSKRMREKREKGLEKELRDAWINRLQNVTERDEFETIYLSKLDWAQYVKSKALKDAFYDVMENHRYKEHWDDLIISQVKERFVMLEQEMKKNDGI